MEFLVDRRRMLKLGFAAAAATGLAACGGGASSAASTADSAASVADSAASAADATTSAAAADGVKGLTFTPGFLTVATGDPAWEPWVMNDDPLSGEGFEAAVIYALAEKMGFAKEEVAWVRTTFDEAYAPGEHDWDLNIQQVSINDDRKKAIDFSPAYFRPTQSIIVKKDSKYASAKSVKDFADAAVAVMVGSTAVDYVKDIMGVEPEVFNTNSDAAAAVSAGQADALVTDTPQCVYMVESEQVADGVVAGQIPGTEDPEGLGITLAKDSPLTPYVTEAMDAILADGTVDGLISKWLAAYTTDIPTLSE